MAMRFTSAGVLAVAVLFAAAPVPGVASPVWPSFVSTITFSGRVTSGTDVTGVFGDAGADLSGLRYELSYELYATPIKDSSVFEYDGWRREYFNNDFISAFTSINMRINNRDYKFASTDWSLAILDSGSSATYWTGGLAVSLYSNNMERIYPDQSIMDYSATYQEFSDPADNHMRSLLTPMVKRAKGPSTGGFSLSRVDFGPNWDEIHPVVSAFGTLNAEWMRITAGGIAPVPLPATVGPFLLALGMGGIFAWRRARSS
jgi:hypothetical protein